MLQLGQIMDNMIQKDQKPNCHSCGAIPGYWEQQQGSVRAPAHNTAKGWADHLSHPGESPCGPELYSASFPLENCEQHTIFFQR